MGRASMQGTPWHYEYGDGKRKSNSKHCVYNVGHCSHKYSQYYKKECEGQLYCDDFERSNFIKSDLDQSKKEKKKKNSNQTKESNTTNKIKQTNVSKTESQETIKIYREYPVSQGQIKLDDKISVINCSTRSTITFHISNPKDPFIGCEIGEQVELKGFKYKIVKIIRKQYK